MNSKSKFLRSKQTKNTVISNTPESKLQAMHSENSAVNTTPLRKSFKEDTEDEFSPITYFTQEMPDDQLDVVWDWYSPKSKVNKVPKKRLIHSSPVIPKKQIILHESVQKFDTLRAELEKLTNTIQKSDIEINNSSSKIFVRPKTPESSNEIKNDSTDLFEDDDDFWNEEMIKCSQVVEEKFNIEKMCNSIFINNKNINCDTTIKDDSFDCFLEEIKDEDIELLSQQSVSSENTLKTISNECLSATPSFKFVPSPRAISRTNSVPTEFLSASKQIFKPCSSTATFVRTKSENLDDKKSISPPMCSPGEIEKKRREARAKLEFKRKEKEIERKRLEAIERLKRNRMQRMIASQSGTNFSK